MTIDAEGNVYVANFVNRRVEKFKPEEVTGHETVVKFVVAFGEGFIGQLAYGSGDVIAVGGPQEDVYVGTGVVWMSLNARVRSSKHGFGRGYFDEGQVGALAVDTAGDIFVQIGTRVFWWALGWALCVVFASSNRMGPKGLCSIRVGSPMRLR